MAPELLEGRIYGPEVDAYSFGLVMWEVGTRQLPWDHLGPDGNIEEGQIYFCFRLQPCLDQ